MHSKVSLCRFKLEIRQAFRSFLFLLLHHNDHCEPFTMAPANCTCHASALKHLYNGYTVLPLAPIDMSNVPLRERAKGCLGIARGTRSQGREFWPPPKILAQHFHWRATIVQHIVQWNSLQDHLCWPTPIASLPPHSFWLRSTAAKLLDSKHGNHHFSVMSRALLNVQRRFPPVDRPMGADCCLQTCLSEQTTNTNGNRSANFQFGVST